MNGHVVTFLTFRQGHHSSFLSHTAVTKFQWEPHWRGDVYGLLISSRVCGTLCTLSVWYFSVMAASLPGSWSLHRELQYCTQPKSLPKTWRFDLYQRPSSEEAGTQFFWFLTRREDGASLTGKVASQTVSRHMNDDESTHFLADDRVYDCSLSQDEYALIYVAFF